MRALALVTLLAAPCMAQQVTTSVDIGGTSMRYADTVSSSGPSVSPALGLEWKRGSLGAGGTYSRFGNAWSTQGTVGGSAFTPAAGLLVGELAGNLGGSAHEDGARTGQMSATARLHAMSARAGGWIGGGAGRTWDGALWRNLLSAEAGAWGTQGPATFVASVTPTAVDDSIRYTDAQLSGRWVLPKLEFGLALGARAGQRVPAVGGTSKAWGSGSATAWAAPNLGIVASAGTYPVDFTQGFPGGRFVTLGVRLTNARRTTAPNDVFAPAASTGGVKSFSVERTAAGRVFVVRVPGATSVEISGDFTSWRPIRLTLAGDGSWKTTLRVAPGVYQMNLRINGGDWIVPPGLDVVKDEFGHAAALLVVE